MRCVRWLCLLFAGLAQAEVVLDRTRFIHPASLRATSVLLTNEAYSPRLVQVWIDAGDARRPPEDSEVPFTLTPPIQRIDAQKGAAVRLFFHPTQARHLPTDRESVFWLNVLSIRPVVSGNAVHMAFRTRVKLFLRPPSLPGPVGQAPAQLQWRLLGKPATALQVRNPSAYYVTLQRVRLRAEGREYRNDDPPMLAPNASVTLPLGSAHHVELGPSGLAFTTLDDHGAVQHHSASVLLD